MARNTSTKTFTAVAPTTGATLVLAANASRSRCLIMNAGGSTVYLGGSGVTTSSGIPIDPGSGLNDDFSTDEWYACVAAGTGDIRVIEVV